MRLDYSQNCDYIRQRFDLPDTVTLYEMIGIVTDHFRNEDDKKLISEQETKEEQTAEAEISKEKKRGRPRKKAKSNSN